MIYLDIDGVLADINPYICQKVNYLLGTDWKPKDLTDYSYPKVFNLDEEWWKGFMKGLESSGMYRELGVFEGAEDIDELPKSKVRIATARMEEWREDTFEWLYWELSCGTATDVPLLMGVWDKWNLLEPGDILVDDNLETVLKAVMRTPNVYLVDRPYNQAVALPPTVMRVEGIGEAVEKMLKKGVK